MGIPEEQSPLQSDEAEGFYKCPVCFDHFSTEQLQFLYCGHLYEFYVFNENISICKDCFLQYIKSKRSDPFTQPIIRCCCVHSHDQSDCLCPIFPSMILNVYGLLLFLSSRFKIQNSMIGIFTNCVMTLFNIPPCITTV